MTGATDVDQYLESQPDEWRDALTRLRDLCVAKLDGYVEVIDYRMPSYQRDGVTEVSFAKQARYLSLYLLKKPVLDAHRSAMAGLDVGKGCIRYRRADQINWDLVAVLLTETSASDAAIC